MINAHQVTVSTAPEVHLVSAVGLVIGGTKTSLAAAATRAT